MTQTEENKKLTGESDGNLFSILLKMSEDTILALTNRTTLPSSLRTTQTKLAIIAYNRLGTEGEISRSEGGISSVFSDIPEDILKTIKSKRLGRVGGRVYEKTNTEET